jgi:hypothetical protein
VSEPRERVEALLGPALASLDAITAAAGEQASVAGQFVQYKLFATYHLADQIREQLLPTTAAPKQDGSAAPTLSKEEKFALYVLVDSFLFEGASIRDALLQFANVIFDLGIAESDRGMGASVRRRLSAICIGTTGLEEWMEPSQPWLKRLRTLRDVATHRRPLRIPTAYKLKLYGPEGGSSRLYGREGGSSRIMIESDGGPFEPLIEFINHTEQNLAGLLKTSLDHLRAFHAEWRSLTP